MITLAPPVPSCGSSYLPSPFPANRSMRSWPWLPRCRMRAGRSVKSSRRARCAAGCRPSRVLTRRPPRRCAQRTPASACVERPANWPSTHKRRGARPAMPGSPGRALYFHRASPRSDASNHDAVNRRTSTPSTGRKGCRLLRSSARNHHLRRVRARDVRTVCRRDARSTIARRVNHCPERIVDMLLVASVCLGSTGSAGSFTPCWSARRRRIARH